MTHRAGVEVRTFRDGEELGRAAALDAASAIRSAIAVKEIARIIVATGNSQLQFIASLTKVPDIDWSKVEAFHLDEYVGMSPDHSASFRLWIRTRFEERVRPGKMHYIEGNAADLDAELQRYTDLLNSGPLDVAFVGIGENGHIAFNDPPVADFSDPLTIKRVVLEEACRRQQVNEGHFPSIDAVPKEAVTLTCSALMRVSRWICCVPERRKAEAVRSALEGPLSTACPASLIREHSHATLYLDDESASLLSR